MKERARKLRENQTKTEARLWFSLRDRRMKGKKFRRQHPIGNYIVDFYCPEAKLAVELDGGGHKLGKQKRYDDKREKIINTKGIRVLRFWDNEVWDNLEGVLEVIYRELPDDPSPQPSPQRGEGVNGYDRGERG